MVLPFVAYINIAMFVGNHTADIMIIFHFKHVDYRSFSRIVLDDGNTTIVTFGDEHVAVL